MYLQINFPDRDEFTNTKNTFLIDKDSKFIERVTYDIDEADEHQHNEWSLSNIKFGAVDLKNFEKEINKYLKSYTVKDYEPRPESELAPLSDGSVAPTFTAKHHTENTINLNDYKGRIVLLDFWYMACGYCVKAFPHLNALQQKYRDDIIVLGVNPIDNDKKSINKIPAFIKRHELSYNVAFIERPVAESYKIHAYPTLYIIDQNGVIQHSEVGFGATTEQDIEKVINKLLHK